MNDNNNRLIWMIRPHVRATISDDGGVLLDIERGLCYSLNPVGAKIWQTLQSQDGSSTLEVIVDTLGPQFPVSRDQLARDVDEYLRDLESKELIKALRKQNQSVRRMT